MNNVETLPVVRIESPEREHPEIQALKRALLDANERWQGAEARIIPGIALHIRDHDVWLTFDARDGRHASFSLAALADRCGPITRRSLRSWAQDRIEDSKAR